MSIRRDALEKIEEKLGRWGILKGSKKYLEVVLKFLEEGSPDLKMLGHVLNLERGLTTNANEIFYLPSKHWKYLDEDAGYLLVRGTATHGVLRLSKQYLKPLIRLTHLKSSPYKISTLEKRRQEDYVLQVENASEIEDEGMRKYLEWAVNFIREEHVATEGRKFSTLIEEVSSNTWTKLPDKSGAKFFFKNAIHRNFAIYMNGILDAQVDKRLFLGYPRINVDDRVMFATLNSVFTYIGMELIGRSNLGEGALDVNVIDYEKIPVVNPLTLEEKLKKDGDFDDLLHVVNEMLKTKPQAIEAEAKNNVRLKMEELVLKPLGFSKNDILSLYEELIRLVNLRAERAASIKEKTRN